MLGTAAAGDYATFGAAPGLGAANFTVETWFRRDGAGVSTSTGTGGVDAIPLVTKGRAEGENSNVDMNYFLGIRASDGVLVADFEEGAAGATPGLNHPIVGHHADRDRAGGSDRRRLAPCGRHLRRHDAASLSGRRLAIVARRRTVRRGPTASSTPGWARPSRRPASRPASSPACSTRRGSGTTPAAPREIATGKTRGDRGRARAARPLGLQRELRPRARLVGQQPTRHDVAGAGWTWVAGAPFTGTTNTAPVVDAGADQTVMLPASASLAAR